MIEPDTASQHLHHAGHDTGTAGGSLLSFFTGDGSYMPRIHCMQTAEGGTDWPWVIGLVLLNVIVIVGYAKIFVFWRKAYLAEENRDRNHKLMDLAWIFLWCAVCGYFSSIMIFFWPAYRLVAICLVPLAFFTWRFAGNLGGFRLALQAKRLERELRETLESRNRELERLVYERTREAEEARAHADQANEAKSRFLANMSHEIRTPMNAILGFTDLMAAPDLKNEERRDHAAIVRRNGEHLMTVINDILDHSKIEAGELTIEPIRFDPRQACVDVCELMRARASTVGITLCMTLSPDLPASMITDQTRLRQILLNLVGNAIKFTSEGSVTLGAEPDGDCVRFTVTDTGIGIEPETLSTIFLPFHQAEASTTRRFGGTGLGLTISKALTQALGGDMEIESTPGKGTRARVTITTALHGSHAESNETAPLPPRQSKQGNESELVRGNTILLVEDGLDNQRLISTHLKRAGALVLVAENGQLAVETIQAASDDGTAIDLVLMDRHMPVMNGVDATRMIRGMGFQNPIIALTASVMPQDQQDMLNAGCNRFLSKPVHHTDLLTACGDALRDTADSRSEAA